MPKLHRIFTRLRARTGPAWQTQLRAFDAEGIAFEVSNPGEHYRVVEHGGETEYTHAMLEYLRPEDVLYDVGANVGLVALHSAKRCRVVAFEPDPSFLDRLRRNMSLNPELELTLLQIAVSDADREVTLYTDGAAGNSPSLRRQRGEEGRVSVQARSLDSLMEEGNLPAPTILKIDIEGAEILALRGATGLLASPQRPRAIFVEVHGGLLGAFGSSAAEVMAILGDAGYTRVGYHAERAAETHYILELGDRPAELTTDPS